MLKISLYFFWYFSNTFSKFLSKFSVFHFPVLVLGCFLYCLLPCFDYTASSTAFRNAALCCFRLHLKFLLRNFVFQNSVILRIIFGFWIRIFPFFLILKFSFLFGFCFFFVVFFCKFVLNVYTERELSKHGREVFNLVHFVICFVLAWFSFPFLWAFKRVVIDWKALILSAFQREIRLSKRSECNLLIECCL